MTVYVVLVTALGNMLEPWGIFSTRAKALEEQLECRQVYRGLRSGSVFGMENCELWVWYVDEHHQYYSPRSDYE